MKNLLPLQLTLKDYRILDQILVQVKGYPIRFAEDKIGFSNKMADSLFRKIRKIAYKEPKVDLEMLATLDFSKEEVIQLMRSLAIVFIEAGPSIELHTINGYKPEEIERTYQKIDKALPRN